jgi:hypothetical protein
MVSSEWFFEKHASYGSSLQKGDNKNYIEISLWHLKK